MATFIVYGDPEDTLTFPSMEEGHRMVRKLWPFNGIKAAAGASSRLSWVRREGKILYRYAGETFGELG